jgi:hypothetical protein
MMPRPWANIIPNIIVSITNMISNAIYFILFKAMCKGWNYARSGEERQSDPWILKSEFITESGAVTFASVTDMRPFEVSFPVWLGKGPD